MNFFDIIQALTEAWINGVEENYIIYYGGANFYIHTLNNESVMRVVGRTLISPEILERGTAPNDFTIVIPLESSILDLSDHKFMAFVVAHEIGHLTTTERDNIAAEVAADTFAVQFLGNVDEKQVDALLYDRVIQYIDGNLVGSDLYKVAMEEIEGRRRNLHELLAA